MEVYAFRGGVHAEAMAYEAKWLWKWAEAEAAEAFRVDDLLDFSNEQIAAPAGEEQFQLSDLSGDSSITVAEQAHSYSSSDKARDDKIPSILGEEDLHVACEDMAQLEWLSAFVEESFSAGEGTEPAPASLLWGGSPRVLSEQSSSSSRKDSFRLSVLESSATSRTAIPGRARSKRSRADRRVWGSGLFSSNSCASLDSISTAFPTIPSFCPALSAETEFLSAEGGWDAACLAIPQKPTKVPRRITAQDASQPRRCTHCLAQRTPQWRAGPGGPKTLCNACGVRFKSGRLLPEYRPAGSPSFAIHHHSNSHRKVLEMRRQKQQQQQLPPPQLQQQQEEDQPNSSESEALI